MGFFDVIWSSGYRSDVVAIVGFDSLICDDYNAL